jgi:hypothetical protein
VSTAELLKGVQAIPPSHLVDLLWWVALGALGFFAASFVAAGSCQDAPSIWRRAWHARAWLLLYLVAQVLLCVFHGPTFLNQ